MTLTPDQRNRARGALLGTATGDALGAGYEFTTPVFDGDAQPEMIGGGLGNFAPGEWTDDTSMMWCIADVAARHGELASETARNEVAANFRAWFDTRPPDVGIQTGAVLRDGGSTAAELCAAAEQVLAKRPQSSGNGSLMRTAAVALPYLDDPRTLCQVAQDVSALTHAEPRAMQACALWSLAIRHAIVAGQFDVRGQLGYLDADDAAFWRDRIGEAETRRPETFTRNGWSVGALQAAWSAIVASPDVSGGEHFRAVMRRAIAIGHDTDTVAAIAGALVGARWGASEIPADWAGMVHGYPDLRGEDLAVLADAATGS